MQNQDPEIHTSTSYYCVPSGGAILGEGRQPQHGVLGVHRVRPRDLQQHPPKIPEPEPSLDQQLCTNRRCNEEQALVSARRCTNRVGEDGLCVVCGGPERRLSALRWRPGGRAPPSAIRRGHGGVGARATGEGARDRQGGHEGTRPLASGGHDPGKWWITSWAAHFGLIFQI